MGNTRLVRITVLVTDNDAGLVVELLPTEEEALRVLYENCGGRNKTATFEEMEAFVNAYYGEDQDGRRAQIAVREIQVEEEPCCVSTLK